MSSREEKALACISNPEEFTDYTDLATTPTNLKLARGAPHSRKPQTGTRGLNLAAVGGATPEIITGGAAHLRFRNSTLLPTG
jgi:hypothetical protein